MQHSPPLYTSYSCHRHSDVPARSPNLTSLHALQIPSYLLISWYEHIYIVICRGVAVLAFACRITATILLISALLPNSAAVDACT